MKSKVIAMLVMALFIAGIVLPAAHAAISINPKEIGNTIIDSISSLLSWYKVDHFETDPVTGDYTKPIYNTEFKKNRQAVNGILFFFFFFSIIYWSSAKFIDKKNARVIMAASISAIMAIGMTSIFDLEVLYPFINHVFFLIVFLMMFMLLATEQLLGKHKGWAFLLALVLSWLAFNSLNVLSAAPGITPNATIAQPTTTLVATWTVTAPTTQIAVGGTIPLTVNNKPQGVDITWSSSDPTKATVDLNTGKVTGVSAGTANIIATASDRTSVTTSITIGTGGAAVTGLTPRDYVSRIEAVINDPTTTQLQKQLAIAPLLSGLGTYAQSNPTDPDLAPAIASLRTSLSRIGINVP